MNTVIGTLKVARDVVGTVGLLFAGYVAIVSLQESRRYLRILRM